MAIPLFKHTIWGGKIDISRRNYIIIDGEKIEKPRHNTLGLAIIEYVIWFIETGDNLKGKYMM